MNLMNLLSPPYFISPRTQKPPHTKSSPSPYRHTYTHTNPLSNLDLEKHILYSYYLEQKEKMEIQNPTKYFPLYSPPPPQLPPLHIPPPTFNPHSEP